MRHPMALARQAGDKILRRPRAVVISNDAGGAGLREMSADCRTDRTRAAHDDGDLVLHAVWCHGPVLNHRRPVRRRQLWPRGINANVAKATLPRLPVLPSMRLRGRQPDRSLPRPAPGVRAW